MPSTNGRNNKKFEIRGLDRRTNKLYRQEGTAYDCDNVYLDSKKTLVKIPDMDENIVPRGILTETGEFLDKLPFPAVITNLIPYKDYIFMVTEFTEPFGTKTINKFYKYFKETNTVEFIPFGSTVVQDPLVGDYRGEADENISGKVRYTILNKCLYLVGDFIDGYIPTSGGILKSYEDNLTLPLEFDGSTIQTAGVTSVYNKGEGQAVDIGTLTGIEYARLTPFHIDPYGNVTFGDYITLESTQAGNEQTIIASGSSINTLTGYQGYAGLLSDFSMSMTDSVAARTLTTEVWEKSVTKGMYLYIIYESQSISAPNASYSRRIYRVLVENVVYVSPQTADITITDFQKYDAELSTFEDSSTISYIYATHVSLASTTICAVYGSAEFTYGFEFKTFATIAYTFAAVSPLAIIIRYLTSKGASALTGTISYRPTLNFITDRFEDMYDEEIVKVLPPPSNSITAYVGTMVLSDKSSVYYSDISLGGNVSNFTPFDNFTAGTEKKGPITGVFASESFLVVFRENESYYITGNIFSGAYQSQSYRSTLIGCVSAASIAEYRGAGVFMSSRGVYLAAQGGQSTELSDIIEPVFTENDLNLGLDLTSTVTLTDSKREYFYFLMDSSVYGKVVLAFSYYHQEWFIFRAPPAEGGVVVVDDTLVSSDGTNIFIEGSGSNAAAAYYTSNFEALGEPAWDKRFLRALVYTPSISEDSEITIKTYKDWDYTTAITDETESIDYPETFVTQRFNDDRSKSCAIKLESLAGDMFITEGYEYEFIADIGNYRDYA